MHLPTETDVGWRPGVMQESNFRRTVCPVVAIQAAGTYPSH